MKTNLKRYLDEDKICVHATTKNEVAHLFNIVKRDLLDASIVSLSPDRRHATAYNGALQLATIVMHASGYRAKSKVGHHWVTFMLIPEFLGKESLIQARYFNVSREKRNLTDYDLAGHVSKEEVEELLREVKQFQTSVISWLKKHRPDLIN